MSWQGVRNSKKANVMICSKCNYQMQDGMRVCLNCGAIYAYAGETREQTAEIAKQQYLQYQHWLAAQQQTQRFSIQSAAQESGFHSQSSQRQSFDSLQRDLRQDQLYHQSNLQNQSKPLALEANDRPQQQASQHVIQQPDPSFGEQPPQVSQPSYPQRKSEKRKRLGAILAGAIAAAVIVVLIGVSHLSNTEKFNGYVDAYNAVFTDMVTGAAEAESVTGMAKRVWYAAIWSKDKASGWGSDIQDYYSTDFNTALRKMYADSKIQNKVFSISESIEACG